MILDLFDYLAESLERWQIYKCHITQMLVSQNQPIKLIYHYEKLSDDDKTRYPLQGELLKQFNQLMTQEQFANHLGIELQRVANPWQLKFTGKLIVFTDNPEIALRLYWTNTLKPFELLYHQQLLSAVDDSWKHWQFIDNVEIINKNPNIQLIAKHDDLPQTWQASNHQQFEQLPSVIALTIQQFLLENHIVKEVWLKYIQAYVLADLKNKN